PSGLKDRAVKVSGRGRAVWKRGIWAKSRAGRPLSASQKLTVPDCSPSAIVRPSGLSVAQENGLWLADPITRDTAVPVVKSQTQTAPSPAVAKAASRLPSWLSA